MVPQLTRQPPPLPPRRVTELLTVSKVKGPFIYPNSNSAGPYPCEDFLASIANDADLQSLHVISYLRSNNLQNQLPPDLWRYYLCAALARHHAYTTSLATPDRALMSAEHSAKYQGFKQSFSTALFDTIQNGNYGRPPTCRQNALISAEEDLTFYSFYIWPSLLLPCLNNNTSILSQMKHSTMPEFLSVIAYPDPQRRGGWVLRPKPAEWLMEHVDKLHDNWIDWPIIDIVGSNILPGLDEDGRWSRTEDQKKKFLDQCEEWCKEIERLEKEEPGINLEDQLWRAFWSRCRRRG